jgi:hypothetical protein
MTTASGGPAQNSQSDAHHFTSLDHHDEINFRRPDRERLRGVGNFPIGI